MGVLHAFILRAWSSLPTWFAFHLFRVLLSNGLSHFVQYIPESRVESESRNSHCIPPSCNHQLITGCKPTVSMQPPPDAAPFFVELLRMRIGLQNIRAAGRIARQLIALCYALPEFGNDDVYLRETSSWINLECTRSNQVLELYTVYLYK